jgi:hypothetical protein
LAVADLFSLSWLRGDTVSKVAYDPPADTWTVLFTSGARLSVPCLWRLLRDGRLSWTSEDHGQSFGLLRPFDALAAIGELEGNTVNAASVREGTGDLTLVFSGAKSLEVVQTSGGYEGWSAQHPSLGTVFLGSSGEVHAIPGA